MPRNDSEVKGASSKVAYICNGLDHHCSMSPGCFLRQDPVSESDMICHHTNNPEYAKYGPCPNPQDHPERFVIYRECEWDDDPNYYELMPEDEV